MVLGINTRSLLSSEFFDPFKVLVKADLRRHHRATTQAMKRVTIRIDKDDLDGVEQLVGDGEYLNRSEAIRAGIREFLES